MMLIGVLKGKDGIRRRCGDYLIVESLMVTSSCLSYLMSSSHMTGVYLCMRAKP